MAIVWAFRIGVLVAPGVWRIVTSGQPSTAFAVEEAFRHYFTDVLDPDAIDAELAALLSARSGYDVAVTTWTSEVGLRKLQIRYSRTPAGGTVEDVAVTTHTFLKVASGVPVETWVDPTDYAAVESAWGTCWAGIKTGYPAWTHLDQYRWYLDNSALRLPDHAPNPALRVTEVDVAGTGTGSCLPPQMAISVTEITASRKSWGRFYLPAMTVANVDVNGRFVMSNGHGSYLSTFYSACKSANLIPVVFAPALPARSSAAAIRAARAIGPSEVPALDIPERAATIYEVTHTQLDDVWDVIRSRRWDGPVARSKIPVTQVPAFDNWRDWAWAMVAGDVLTIREVTERLALELLIERALLGRPTWT